MSEIHNSCSTRRPKHRKSLRAVFAALIASAAVMATAGNAAAVPAPYSMGALGDSITVAFNGGEFPPCIPYIDCPRYSWSTGWANPDSHYNHIFEINPGIEGNNINYARDGSKADDMLGQAQKAVADGVEYVTVEIGGNDACTRTEQQMTPINVYRQHIQQTVDLLTGNGIRVFIASVPAVERLHELFWQNPTARLIWALGQICQSLLKRPISFAQADVERRARVAQRVVDYDTQLEEVCAEAGELCKFDGNLIHDFPFPEEAVSHLDYFHPSFYGQRLFAFTYEVSFDWEAP